MEEVGGTPRRKVSQDPDKSAGKLPAGCARLCVCVCVRGILRVFAERARLCF